MLDFENVEPGRSVAGEKWQSPYRAKLPVKAPIFRSETGSNRCHEDSFVTKRTAVCMKFVLG
jgi:hypothetical protein